MTNLRRKHFQLPCNSEILAPTTSLVYLRSVWTNRKFETCYQLHSLKRPLKTMLVTSYSIHEMCTGLHFVFFSLSSTILYNEMFMGCELHLVEMAYYLYFFFKIYFLEISYSCTSRGMYGRSDKLLIFTLNKSKQWITMFMHYITFFIY